MGYRYLDKSTAVATFASEPPVAVEGSLYFNTTDDIFYISNGTTWNLVSNANPSTTGGTVTINAISEGGTFSYDLGTDYEDDVDTDAELTYTLVSGTMPSGATLPTSGNSALTGTASGVSSNTNYTFTIKATDTSGGTATQDYQQQINNVAPTVTGGTVAISAVTEASAMSYDVDTDFTYATGSTFSVYSVQSGTLPSGASLNTATGVISGTAGNVGSNTTYTFTIRGTDTDGDTVDQGYTWVINTVAPTVTGGTVTISATSEGASASYDVDTNFTYPTGTTRKSTSAYAVQSGSLPSGLSLNADTGVINGTAGNNASFSFTIRGTDTDGDTADQQYTWVINNVAPTSTGGTVTISAVNEGSSASYDVDTNFTFTTGSAFSAFSVASGSLPSGLSLNTSTGVINGTMGTVSSNTAYSFTIRGTDTNSDYVDQGYSWTITNVPFSATGGTITTVSGYKIHTFTSSASGASGFVPNKSGTVDVMVVAAGGCGGGDMGGGGGAGGMIVSTGFSVSASSYSIVIGAGGTGTITGDNPGGPKGTNGGNTTFSTITTLGGGAGQTGHRTAQSDGQANSGGSGGGASAYSGALISGASGTSGQGNAGGNNNNSSYNSAGGGGKGTVGVNAAGACGPGGTGLQNNYDGTNHYYAGGGGGGGYNTHAGNGGAGGGGGGGHYGYQNVQVGTGGSGRNAGGNGITNTNHSYGGAGGANTGGGGGAGGYSSKGGAGGSGIVIIRYAA